MNLRSTTLLLALIVLPAVAVAASENNPPPKPVDEIIRLYMQAVGGQAAVDRISSRQLEIGKATLYWQAPNKVLRVHKNEKEGYSGETGWAESKRKRITRLARAQSDALQTDANPIRFVHLRTLYMDLQPAPAVDLESKRMDVIVSPNHIGSTKFFFDAQTHLLARIEEFGVNSAYYKNTIDFSDYKDLDGVKMPVRIHRETDEPGAEKGELKLEKIKQNVTLAADLFSKPDLVPARGGGKR